jgi:hypothetical protein
MFKFNVLDLLKFRPVISKLIISLKDGKISKVERDEILKEAVSSAEKVFISIIDKKVKVVE